MPASDHWDPGGSAGRGRWAAAQPMLRGPRPARLPGSEPRLGAAAPRHAIRKPPPPEDAVPTRRTHLEMGGASRSGSPAEGVPDPKTQALREPSAHSLVAPPTPVGGSQGPRLRLSPASTPPNPCLAEAPSPQGPPLGGSPHRSRLRSPTTQSWGRARVPAQIPTRVGRTRAPRAAVAGACWRGGRRRGSQAGTTERR